MLRLISGDVGVDKNLVWARSVPEFHPTVETKIYHVGNHLLVDCSLSTNFGVHRLRIKAVRTSPSSGSSSPRLSFIARRRRYPLPPATPLGSFTAPGGTILCPFSNLEPVD